MPRLAAGLLLALGIAVASPAGAWADDGSEGKNCKAGWHMCACKMDERPLRTCENEAVYKKTKVCWGDIAQYQIGQGKKAEVMAKVFAEAKKSNKLVLYIANTGG